MVNPHSLYRSDMSEKYMYIQSLVINDRLIVKMVCPVGPQAWME